MDIFVNRLFHKLFPIKEISNEIFSLRIDYSIPNMTVGTAENTIRLILRYLHISGKATIFRTAGNNYLTLIFIPNDSGVLKFRTDVFENGKFKESIEN